MSRRAKRAVVATVLAWLAFWPLVHRGVVARYEINPWKLGGFAMYTVYWSSKVALFEPTPAGLRFIDDRRLAPEARRVLRRFRGQRNALGRLREPDDVARAVFAAHRDLDRLVVVVQRLWLDPDTARIDSAKTQYPYERGIDPRTGLPLRD